MSTEKMNKKCSMTIAGLDPSGGAGIIADCKTFHAHGIYATCVVTAITAQNPYSVSNIGKVDLQLIEDEIDQIMDVYPIEFMKTGVLYSGDIIKLVSKKIKEYQLKAVVDPVMISESGKNLTGDSYVTTFKKYLMKNAYIITPNIHEAENISNKKIETEEDMINVAEKLSNSNNTVITGGHMQGNDILYTNGEVHKIKGELIKSNNTHGTGCTYSSAITSQLINNHDLLESCKLSNQFIRNSIINGFNNTPYQFWNSIKF
ncbi:bifunctional hydroxymethylpyrimidine kinase/phosphomethylpyrimidine kinase [Candidatus Methanosphaera massiliense]|jgi:hydroxymethylpyrimidine/phosphomethylpyrimidine kinase|uniref:bifunctional hydroxymethylpyrimidine kinase/phosphomethylpyrimidine kinase n=1 Tax=Methanosphaera TaxID=2316 RepID=UPI0023801728|nr:bifunctional hydroxymethylpyrimidine kinase/phosphomethylpyrimidine kinase [Candidatus Methanosphaera massiliense]MDD6285602.1 bifunctional hydroxymethylpyrimidine kinase/phosphomethylpyrimidine kinase [Methanobacteriaceae archaeon]MDE4079068.1 bifunctional hydroxymethylpyrimidine kinase/phosphomethylpyrimidine kinase [Candidatus Methanosphaera massiliense]